MTKRVLIRRGKVAVVGDEALARARHALEVHGVSGDSVKAMVNYGLAGSALVGPKTPSATKASQPRSLELRLGTNRGAAMHFSGRLRLGK